ncbi:hypothetical protein ACLB2K_063243 [Fragaria x ananassa]
MTHCNDLGQEDQTIIAKDGLTTRTCPSCGYQIKYQQQAGIQYLPGLPAGVKFDPTDQEVLQHLEGKVLSSTDIAAGNKLHHHPLIDQFIPTIEGENGICYTHPHKLPGVSKDGLVRHFFHRPSKAYTTGSRKRRKVHTDRDSSGEGGETRWHKTGKTRPVFAGGKVKGYKKILVLYTNYGKQRKPEKTNWVMHQYHLGNNEEEKDGELVVSKVFFQTQPRQCGNSGMKDFNNNSAAKVLMNGQSEHSGALVQYCNNVNSFISFDQNGQDRSSSNPQIIPRHFPLHDGSFVSLK